MNDTPCFIGIMTGTSLDGADLVAATFDGRPQLLGALGHPMPDALRQELLALNAPGDNELARAALAANALSRLYADAVGRLLAATGIDRARVRAIGSHGQTLRHRPDLGFTIQLQNPALLAELTGLPVVADFRSRDVAAGGQGAPLVPAFHAHLFRHPGRHRAIINIGGIANITDLPPAGPITGFDSGPGNMLLDAWIQRHQGAPYDCDGAWAESGRVLPALLARLLADPFFAAPPPKSTGRDLFSLAWLEAQLDGTETAADVQATLLEVSAQSLAGALAAHCPGVEEIYLCGGGARNSALQRRLAALARLPVADTGALGADADWLEAFAFAWLAMRTLDGEPGNLPEVTGAAHPCVLGAIYPA